ncbi:phosphatidate cytidylyltransferase [Dehalogenimonas formicexedens]|uniref:Phosphatidate cytidylyltransferase n=1 Tax=Dehalogenimonas formicexedens TaxID=1839801 RepID=A0A1P8F957_9CHLR|nr:phosphatidate cytidylyltransferase [Dehalogenimonas formicexedens]APV44997.1 phosphatidate cytidylyltransferase [Dehalogenimonas formicexedens]
MLKTRLISGFILGLAALLAVWFDQPIPWLTIGAAIWGVLALREFNRVVTQVKAAPFAVIGSIAVILLIVSPHFENSLTPILTGFAALSLLYLLKPGERSKRFIQWTWTLAGVIYVGLLLSFLVALRGLDNGRDWVLFALGVTVASDSFAYFIGRSFGRHKMAPTISPAKSWEGAAAGLIAAAAVGLALKAVFDLPSGFITIGILSVFASIVGQAGDLVESLFKRNMAVKDSSQAIPGHGGLLDRMDSVVFAVIAVYYYVIIFVQ